jgi:cytosine deaminase
VLVSDGVIRAIAPRGQIRVSGVTEYLGEGRLMSLPFADPHIHLDAVLTLGEPRHNETGTLLEGIQIWSERKKSLTVADVKERAREAVLWEVAQGTGLIRSHVDVCDPSLTAVRALLELREELKDLVELQLIAFPQEGVLAFDGGAELMEEAMRAGFDVVGGIPHYELTREDGIEEIRFIFQVAARYGKPIDLHCDETDDEQSRFVEHVAAHAIRLRMEGRVAVSHVTAMGSYNGAYLFKLLRILRRAGITVVVNPLTNLTLQGRFDAYPKRRGLAPVKELDASGVNVACGHDCIMDPWYPLGRGSMLDPLFLLVHAGQMTGRTELFRAYDMVTVNPVRAAGFDWSLEEGKPANFVVLDCEDEAEAVRLRPAALWVVRSGRIVAETAPGRTVVRRADGTEIAVAMGGNRSK